MHVRQSHNSHTVVSPFISELISRYHCQERKTKKEEKSASCVDEKEKKKELK